MSEKKQFDDWKLSHLQRESSWEKDIQESAREKAKYEAEKKTLVEEVEKVQKVKVKF